MHRDWCGRECAECKEQCDLDEILLCSPDCEHLGPDGEFTDECSQCDAYKGSAYQLNIERLLKYN